MPAGMRGGAAKGERRGGGSRKARLNRRTIELAKQAEIELRNAQEGSNLKLPKEILFESANALASMMAYYQPTPAGVSPQNANGDEAKFEKYARLTLEFARAAAQYYSPIFKAIAVSVGVPGAPPPPEDNRNPLLLEMDRDGNVERIGGLTEATRVYEAMCEEGRKQG